MTPALSRIRDEAVRRGNAFVWSAWSAPSVHHFYWGTRVWWFGDGYLGQE